MPLPGVRFEVLGGVEIVPPAAVIGHSDARAADMATINVKLDGISDDTRDIKEDMRALRETISDLTERVVKVETSLKETDKRLDTLERRIKQED